ncbi:hypothetical protein BDV93DRAFT_513649 [Ceratobasidium sp. AG-I]|nr:hypothetical protein BDV93DRAFT_513649 [Ceratobasidium sp. AG-I]
MFSPDVKRGVDEPRMSDRILAVLIHLMIHFAHATEFGVPCMVIEGLIQTIVRIYRHVENSWEIVCEYAELWNFGSGKEEIEEMVEELQWFVAMLFEVGGWKKVRDFRADFFLVHLVTSDFFENTSTDPEPPTLPHPTCPQPGERPDGKPVIHSPLSHTPPRSRTPPQSRTRTRPRCSSLGHSFP